jgi:2-methylcitrate dehydratase PrpD
MLSGYMGLTSRLAEFVGGISFGDLPSQVVDRSKAMMINAAAAGLAGAAQPEGRVMVRFIQEMRGNGKCTIMGTGLRTSPVYAALANGALVHLLDFDDEIPRRGNHPSCVVFPVVMALGEMNGSSGKEVITAFALGCEVCSKLGAMGDLEITPHPRLRHPLSIDMEMGPGSEARRGWHREGVAGTIGATAAAAKLLGLDRVRLENAFGIASGEAAGVQANWATASRAFQCGRAAMNGIMAALLAQEGLTGARDAIEAPGGLLDCYTPHGLPLGRGNDREVDEAAFFSLLANPYDIIHPGVALKVYPCASASHTSIEAMLQLVQQYRIAAGQAKAVRVSVTPAMLQLLPVSDPQNGWQARFSLNYVVAVALLYGQPLIDHFTDAAVRDQRLRELMARVRVEADETATPLIYCPSTVTVTLDGGAEVRRRADFARGQPELPLSDEELDAKFLYCTRYILPPDHIEGAIGQFRSLEAVQNITALASILGG